MPRPHGSRSGTRQAPTAASTTGVLGVSFCLSSKRAPYLVAAWTGLDGKIKTASRSIVKRGYDQALLEVTAIRKAKEAEINRRQAAGKVYMVRVQGSRANGWQVRWPKWLNASDSAPCSRFFSIGVFGNEIDARNAAEAHTKQMQAALLERLLQPG